MLLGEQFYNPKTQVRKSRKLCLFSADNFFEFSQDNFFEFGKVRKLYVFSKDNFFKNDISGFLGDISGLRRGTF